MRKVKADQLYRPTKEKESPYDYRHKYTVHTGANKILHFASKRNAAAWLAEYSRFLNTNLIELNQLYIETFVVYRNIWFLLAESNQELERVFKGCLNVVEHRLSACMRAEGSGKHHAFFTGIRMAADQLDFVCSELSEKCRNGNQWHTNHIVKSIAFRVSELVNRVEKYATSDPG